MNTLFFKYFIKQKKFILFFILVLLSSISISTFSKFQNKKSKDVVIERYNEYLEISKYELVASDEEFFEAGYDSKEKIDKIREESKIKIKEFEEFIDKIENNDWQYLYTKELESKKTEDDRFVYINILEGTDENYSLTDETKNISYEILLYLKENNIPSAHPLDLQSNYFENPKTPTEQKALEKYSKKTLLGNNHRLWDFLNSEFVFVYVVIIVFTTGTLFSSLYNEQNKTIRFLKSSGVTENKVLRSGLFVGSFVTVLIGIVILKIISIAEFLINGTSSLKYPIVSYSVEKIPDLIEKNIIMDYKIITIYDVLIKSLGMFLLYGLLIFLTSSLVAIILKNTTKTIISTLGLILTLQIFKGHLNPFSYWHIGNIVDGGINVINKNANYSYNKCMMILLAVNISIILILFAINIIKNKKILQRGL